MGGRRGIALGSLLVGGGLVAGLLIGRATVPRTRNLAAEPPASSTRFHQELTDTTPLAALPVEEPPAVPPTPSETRQPASTAPLAGVAPAPAKPAAPAPAPAAPPAPAPAPVTPPAAAPEAEPAPPPPDPGLVSQGRVFNGDSVTSSSFDEADVTEYDPVPDHEVTRSSFDDEDRADSHPTGP
jgi:hypothetical protein